MYLIIQMRDTNTLKNIHKSNSQIKLMNLRQCMLFEYSIHFFNY